MKYITLYNNVKMPQLGFGTYHIDPMVVEYWVTEAFKVGYRLIDTAQSYYNEECVGEAVKNCGIDRSEIFLVSKIWISNYGYERAKASIEKSLERLQTDYIDLMLLHLPYCDYYGAYRALEEAYRAGKLRAIGLSNFTPNQFIDLAANVNINPAVNQVETHVFCQQIEAQKYMRECDIQIMSTGALADGREDLFTNSILEGIAQAHGRTVAQVALRYLTQRNVIIVPKTITPERMVENFSIYDFELTPEEMDRIVALDTGKTRYDPTSPRIVKMFMGTREWYV